MRPAQDPVVPLLVGGLVAVAVVALLSILVWVWAIRRPPQATSQTVQDEPSEFSPLVYAVICSCDLLGLTPDEPPERNWIDIIHKMMPEGTLLARLGGSGATLGDANWVDIPAAVKAKPDVITLWSVVNDATQGTSLVAYTKELVAALNSFVRGTRAQVVLLNLPDISLLAQAVSDEQRLLVRGGVEQWNRAISEVAARYGKRVRLVDLFPVSAEILDVSSDDTGMPGDHVIGGQRLAELIWAMLQSDGVVEGTL